MRFTPLGLSLEELSKVWSIFFQSPYVLSVVYQGSAVLIETDDVAQQALPVQMRNIYVLPFRQPAIEKVVRSRGRRADFFRRHAGRQRKATARRHDPGPAGRHRENAFVCERKRRSTLAIPPDLQAGARGLQVIHKLSMGSPGTGTSHRGFESNVATFVLRPQIILPIVKTTVPDPQGGAPLPALQLTTDVTIGKNQRVALLLNSTTALNPPAHSFLSSPRVADSTSMTNAIPGVGAGQYFVRLQVDGAESPLDLDPASPGFGPTVTLP